MITHNLCFEKKYEKYQNFLSERFPYLVVKLFEQACFRNVCLPVCFLIQPLLKRGLF